MLHPQFWPRPTLLRLCSTATLVMLLPACVGGWRWARSRRAPTAGLLWLLTASALSFFLASYQVHEKSILLPALPATLLLADAPAFSVWFAVAATFSMHPLLFKDGLAVPYCLMQFAYLAVMWPALHRRWLLKLTLLPMAVLHVAAVVIPPPQALPDLHNLATAAYCAVLFTAAWAYCCVQLLRGPQAGEAATKIKCE